MDAFIREMTDSLDKLVPEWREQVKKRQLKLDDAVKIGAELNAEQQIGLYEFLAENHMKPEWWNKVLLAFKYDLPRWAVRQILSIYRLAHKVRSEIIMYNDLMDVFEQLFIEEFEAAFLEGRLPEDEFKLEDILNDFEKRLKALQSQAPNKSEHYNKTYGDSSTSSRDLPGGLQGSSNFRQIIGADETASSEEMRKKARHLLKVLHPDHGGSAYLFNFVKQAYEQEENKGQTKPR
ncbi:molecular chaperone DnaJ [Ferviditalea candida]|uniref:Molecular chaperone DnaJ n=1 Tax=Ferviditalea candida TaxID=3108399 RepID=A0ABU5ZHG5_9BACL|nr:molecular chaperone DnaJ [Paenibacillaceae bacterium T2]